MKTRISLVSKFTSVLMVVIASFIFCDVYTAYGGLIDKISIKKPSGGSSVSRNDLDQLYFLVSEADKLLQKSLDTVFRMLANKDEIQRLEMLQKEIDNTKDPKEKEAKIQEIYKDKMRIVEEKLQKEETSREIGAFNDEQKKLFANAIFNIFLAGLRDGQAVEKTKQLSQIIRSNPMYAVSFAGDLDKLVYIVATLPPQVTKTLKIGNNLVRLAQANKIEPALPKSSEEVARKADWDETQPDTKTEKPKGATADLGNKQPSPEKSLAAELPNKQQSQDTKMEKPRITALEDKQPSPAPKAVIVTWTFVIIRSDAGNESPVVAKVKQGDKLFVIGENGEWLNVRLENGQQGWVKKMVCKVI